ncbi:MAG: TrkH family potassium uptake protein [Alphaproteobacteria bacterium]
MIDLRPILLVTGVLLATLGCAMMIPALYDLTVGHEDWLIFSASATITLFVGVGLAFANRGRTESFSIKQAFLLTNVIWVSLTAFGALPFAWSQLDISYTDAFFESMSGITTTGATILTGLDKAPPGILLWRALLQWLGGLGIIVMAISLLPILQVGGMQLFRVEGFETEGKFMPRATQIAGSLSVLYLAITTICAVTYYIAGMSVFDAVVHSMTTIATGGFSSHDASIAYFSSPLIEAVSILFMIAGSLPFVLYLKELRGGRGALFADSQVRWFFGTAAIFCVLAFIAYQPSQPEPLGPRLITIVFNVVSIMTGTGYATTAYDTWSAMAVVVFFILMFIGGCSGSTSCGMKIFRFQIIFEMIRCRLQAVIHPKGVFVERYNGAPIADTVTSAVMGFFFLFLLCFAIIATLLTFIGLDTVTALSAAASAVANVGPGLGQIVGPVGTYAGLPDSAKWILSFGMLLGRLEIFTVIVLFTPTYWRA